MFRRPGSAIFREHTHNFGRITSKLPEDGAPEAPKHVESKFNTIIIMFVKV
jgi:hypothetical protein